MLDCIYLNQMEITYCLLLCFIRRRIVFISPVYRIVLYLVMESITPM